MNLFVSLINERVEEEDERAVEEKDEFDSVPGSNSSPTPECECKHSPCEHNLNEQTPAEKITIMKTSDRLLESEPAEFYLVMECQFARSIQPFGSH